MHEQPACQLRYCRVRISACIHIRHVLVSAQARFPGSSGGRTIVDKMKKVAAASYIN
jgi:hypothetical protein